MRKRWMALAAVLAAVLAFSGGAGQAQTPAPAQPIPVPAGWAIDWHDEFDGTALDRSKWVPEPGGQDNGNNEKQFYTERP